MATPEHVVGDWYIVRCTGREYAALNPLYIGSGYGIKETARSTAVRFHRENFHPNTHNHCHPPGDLTGRGLANDTFWWVYRAQPAAPPLEGYGDYSL